MSASVKPTRRAGICDSQILAPRRTKPRSLNASMTAAIADRTLSDAQPALSLADAATAVFAAQASTDTGASTSARYSSPCA